ncbi:membrane associated rhomboid family serine protease [Halorubrum alkaliphilum]|uniref:Membrane associated rhomboid family serine protease n=1 Tax=Halorubrum alkaliphilum TaxID=261290 RepID=A0A8T4GHU7_9EURY|nr:hypothetical protein [Halorubrum alkaliphilum]MBP1923200.1 membrane associated rhomboid family serine protease [Halorubrum alkaliphilum]
MRGSADDERTVDDADRDSVSGEPAPPSVRGLFGALSRAVRSRPPGELALVALPLPTLLVVVAVLPGTDAWALSLAAEGPFESRWTLWTAFASSFVHTDATHLLDNVVNYWLLVAVAYPLSVVAGWRRRLAFAAVAYLLLVPLVSAWATLLAFGGTIDAPAAGFSDVNGAFLGYLVVVWFAALAAETGSSTETASSTTATTSGIDARWSLVVVFGSLAVVFLSPSGAGYFPPSPWVSLPFAVVAVAAGGLLYSRVGRPRLAGLDLAAPRELLYVTGASVVVAGVIGSLVVVPVGSNVFAHLAGYAVGFSVAFCWVIADSSRGRR